MPGNLLENHGFSSKKSDWKVTGKVGIFQSKNDPGKTAGKRLEIRRLSSRNFDWKPPRSQYWKIPGNFPYFGLWKIDRFQSLFPVNLPVRVCTGKPAGKPLLAGSISSRKAYWEKAGFPVEKLTGKPRQNACGKVAVSSRFSSNFSSGNSYWRMTPKPCGKLTGSQWKILLENRPD
jgi:hypothetical protein